MEFSGDFETHLTLRAESDAEISSSAAWAAEQGLKFTHIRLDRGDTPSQPMVTYHGHGTLTGQRATADRWKARLAGAGFEVVREKHEVSPHNADVPSTRAEAIALGPGHYFETHLKLLLPSDADLDGLSRLVGPHQARLSRNARRTREDGRQERFVTQRCSGVGGGVAFDLYRSLTRALREHGLGDRLVGETGEENGVLDVEREFVVYDSALDLDAGWMDDDAVLLAESHRPPRDLLMRVLRPSPDVDHERVTERYLRDGENIDTGDYGPQEWEHFVRDCPWGEGELGEWVDRFEQALAPTFERGPEDGRG